MITASIVAVLIVPAALFCIIARRSGQLRTATEDDEQCAILAEQTSKRLIAFPNTAVSTSQ